MRSFIAASAIALAFACSPVAGAQAQDAFYKGRTLTVHIGFGNTGSYDFYGRLLSRHIGRELPGAPTVIVQNMPGAGSTKLANWMYSVAPKDGTAIGIASQTVALDEVLGAQGVSYKAARFNWIGRVTSSGEVMIVSAASGVTSFEDVRRREVVVGTTGAGSPSQGYPVLMNAAAGAKFKIIPGYPSSGDVLLALEKGEVDAASGLLSHLTAAHKSWLDDRKVRIILSETVERSPLVPDAPAVGELGDTPEDRAMLRLYATTASIGRAFLAPPDMPADRVATLRAAFDAMVKSSEFKADVEKVHADLIPLSGIDLQKIVAATAETPPAVVARMKRVMQTAEK
ncbi:MAG: tripartite tricarboxylate transporter family receptor [Hyphomicrobiales bacterium]|nr:tripartite tricarboxylate transporter family receptor [Hyphomicrobiales bacterium]